MQPLPEGTVFPGQRVTDKPLPAVTLTDTDTEQAPLGGSCVTSELRHLSVAAGLSMIPTFLPDLNYQQNVEKRLLKAALSTKSPPAVRGG